MRIALLACTVVTLVACGGSAAVSDLDGVVDLRSAFNADRGQARLILLLSPS